MRIRHTERARKIEEKLGDVSACVEDVLTAEPSERFDRLLEAQLSLFDAVDKVMAWAKEVDPKRFQKMLRRK